MPNNIEIKQAKNEQDFLEGKTLIMEYVTWLNVDLSFQNFDKEISTMPITYGYPDGGLFIAFMNNKAVGVAGIKRFSETECEVKRMFVKPEFRGLKIGKLLLTACIENAQKLNYKIVKLDTVDFMQSAIKLYIQQGFKEIPAYRFNPDKDARYFELVLKEE